MAYTDNRNLVTESGFPLDSRATLQPLYSGSE
jgi:hypothetical protein